ncbi:NAD-dependent protein deacylase-like protein [Phanerochaete sordida]|uniref:NAD-dependent protein deacylase-like protein n=1 Tax=Phanerochaete sordida TaxID=48140 RepID=A0A9P3G9C6_9APHY|nr:NAD-dependent protein deacylase-like protein [Phanerochaete sordida]
MPSTDVEEFRRVVASAKHIVVLAGAGLSAASGIPTFRGPSGLWKTNDALRLVTPAAWREDPSRIWRWANYRREMISKASPNAAHRALALLSLPSVRSRLGYAADADFTLVTQNIDELSTRALDALLYPQSGFQLLLTETSPEEISAEINEAKARVLEMHGRVWDVVCTRFECQHKERNYDVPVCAALAESADISAGNALPRDETTTNAAAEVIADSVPQSPLAALHSSIRAPPPLRRTGLRPPTPPPPIPLEELPRCNRCGSLVRPGEVWFGEAAMDMDEIFARVNDADLCIVVGTSATIHPAAKFAATVKERGGKVAVFNLERTKGDDASDFLFLGPCEKLLPEALGIPTEVIRPREAASSVYSLSI